MNVTTGNNSTFVGDELTPTSNGTTVDYLFTDDWVVSTVNSWTVGEPEIEIEVKWNEPLDMILEAMFVAVVFMLVAAFFCAKLAARARLRWGPRFVVDMRIGAGRLGAARPDGINDRNVALRNLV